MTPSNKRTLIGYALAALFAGLLFRIPGDLRDGLSERAVLVGWWSWHLLGWLSRDLFQAIIVLWLGIRGCLDVGVYGKNAIIYLFVLLNACAIAAFFAHNFLYTLAVENRHLFSW